MAFCIATLPPRPAHVPAGWGAWTSLGKIRGLVGLVRPDAAERAGPGATTEELPALKHHKGASCEARLPAISQGGRAHPWAFDVEPDRGLDVTGTCRDVLHLRNPQGTDGCDDQTSPCGRNDGRCPAARTRPASKPEGGANGRRSRRLVAAGLPFRLPCRRR